MRGINMNDFIKELKRKLKDNDSVDGWVKQHIKTLFDSPYIYKYYQLLKAHRTDDSMVQLVLAWMALLSGDNLSLSRYSMILDEDKFTGNQRSFFYDLHALSGVFGSPEDRIKSSDKSIENLEEPVDFYHANAYLTKGQIHNGFQAYRQAYDNFYKAFEIFFKEKMMFPSSVSMTNALLAKYYLADFASLIRQGKKALLMASSMDQSTLMYWDVVRLPLGMAYYEQGYLHEASYHLEKALKSIDHLSLVHMHGLVELSLLKVYALDGNQRQFDRIQSDIENGFEQITYPIVHAILILGTFLRDGNLSLMDIEQLQLIYQEDKHPQMFVVELLMYLSNANHELYIELDDFIKYIEHCRYNGNLVSLVSLSLLLADYYLIHDEKTRAKVIIDEAMIKVKKYALKSVLYIYPYESLHYIERKYPFLVEHKKNKGVHMTEKEIEVLQLLKEGCTNKDIAERLFISVGTVKWHMNHILSKLDAKNRTQAVQEAIKLGIYKNLT